jgi:hypothetical protein
VIIFHCPLPGFYPVGWLGDLLFSLVSILSHYIRLLGVLKKGKFLIFGSAYTRGLSAPNENAGFDHKGCDHFSTIFHASKKHLLMYLTRNISDPSLVV